MLRNTGTVDNGVNPRATSDTGFGDNVVNPRATSDTGFGDNSANAKATTDTGCGDTSVNAKATTDTGFGDNNVNATQYVIIGDNNRASPAVTNHDEKVEILQFLAKQELREANQRTEDQESCQATSLTTITRTRAKISRTEAI